LIGLSNALQNSLAVRYDSIAPVSIYKRQGFHYVRSDLTDDHYWYSNSINL